MIQLNGLGWQAQLCPDFGMNTVRLLWQGEDILRFPETEEALQSRPCVYGTPILMPANRTEGGCFSFEGRQYRLPINDPAGSHHLHGFLNRTPFTLEAITESSADGYYVNSGAVYPFPFRLDVRVWINEAGYHQQYRITNTGDGPMPLTFGLHTTFLEKAPIRVPLGAQWECSDTHIPTGRKRMPEPRLQAFAEGFTPDGAPVSGFFSSAGTEARIGSFRYQVSGNFDQWILWNGNGKQGFLSVEPQQGAVNALNSGTGLLTLLPGKTETYQTCICPVSG